MKLWIRVDAAMPRDPELAALADELRVALPTLIGHVVTLWGVMAEHAVDGNLSDVTDATIERWAGWVRPRGAFASAFRARFVGEHGILRGWADRQGALLRRMERDRERWHARKPRTDSDETPRRLRVDSASTERNGTEHLTPVSPPAPDGANGSAEGHTPPAQRKALVPTPDEEAVLAHYRARHPKSKPRGDKILRVIRRALETYSLDELRKAIDGNADDEWHVQNAKHELTYVLRDTEQIDKFIRLEWRLNAPLKETDPARYAAMGGVL